MSTQGDKLKEIADAIRAKDGTTAPIPANTFKDRIAAIETGVDTSDATATAEDIIGERTAYAKGEQVFGILQPITFALGTPFTADLVPTVSGSGRYIYLRLPNDVRVRDNSAANSGFSANFIVNTTDSQDSIMCVCVQSFENGSYETHAAVGGSLLYSQDCTVSITTGATTNITIFLSSLSSTISLTSVDVAFGSFFGYYI